MLRTEAEAKQQWCPFVRQCRPGDSGVPTFNRDDDGLNCIGSACMAWRRHDQIGLTPEGKKVDRDLDGRTRWVNRGYCGLAGKPEVS